MEIEPYMFHQLLYPTYSDLLTTHSKAFWSHSSTQVSWCLSLKDDFSPPLLEGKLHFVSRECLSIKSDFQSHKVQRDMPQRKASCHLVMLETSVICD